MEIQVDDIDAERARRAFGLSTPPSTRFRRRRPRGSRSRPPAWCGIVPTRIDRW
jgi:hypothetical protein